MELRASIVIELRASVTVSLLLIGSFPTRVSFIYARQIRATRVCNTFLASDWFFSYARKFSCMRVGSELRASILSDARSYAQFWP